MLKIKFIAALFALPLAVCNASSLSMSSASISDSITASSDSISNSSKSSSNAIKNAEGDYKVIGVADAAGHPNQKRIELVALNKDQPALFLFINKDEFARADLTAGRVVSAHARPYGLAFTRQGDKEAFAVVLNDSWLKDLNPSPVV
ncbi:hypothetical protein [Paludibacterium yongneupense]|uniref:hypothetical protein n=1 Tax=Paludibacterium yongneupense TaxID=400061 RepID=UPI00040FB39E|nr:hypothetical protein [Paludibacterium yongneupense]